MANLQQLDAVNSILAFSAGNGLENAAAGILGEPIRVNHIGDRITVSDVTMHSKSGATPVPYIPSWLIK